MRLPGYLDASFTPAAPSIYAQLESGAVAGRKTIAFMIDTRASVTTILDRDRERLGLNWNRLSLTSRPLSGVGGTVDTRLVEDGLLLFRAQSGEMIKEKLAIHVAKHDTKRLDRRGKGLVLQLPSLLGRDLMERYRLVYDKPRTQVYLER